MQVDAINDKNRHMTIIIINIFLHVPLISCMKYCRISLSINVTHKHINIECINYCKLIKSIFLFILSSTIFLKLVFII